MAVLVLSPDQDLRAWLAFALRHRGVDVEVADLDASTPLQPVQAPILLLLDYSTAQARLCVAAAAAHFNDDCPRVMLTPAAGDNAEENEPAPGMLTYLHVPIAVPEMVARVQKMVRDHEVTGYARLIPS